MSHSLHVATRKGLFTITPTPGSARTWSITQTAFLGDNVSMVLPRNKTIFAGLNHGHFGVKMHRSTDGGRTWELIAAPAFPPKPENEPDTLCPMRGIVIPWSVQLIWALEAGPDGKLWCGTIPGGLFTSTDDGSTWSLVDSLWNKPERKKWFGGGYDYPGIHSICLNAATPKRITLGVSCGGVWVSEDGGATWACRADGMRNEYTPPDQAQDPNTQDAHRLVQCAAKPDHFWVQHHNGIFRSTDNSASWQEVTFNAKPAAFGFAVAVHPQDPDTAWFVPAIKDEKRIPVDGKLVVSRTRDGGRTFDILTTGLPQQHAYDIAYRHCLEVAPDGRTLAMGTTTGSLYLSDNAGESWQCVSNHLPPVHAVRFAE
ncbi:MAG: exo-alpha-sialidase [Planctomycetes bacterium]|nr:exo-alpha-sialidase [Planctomycetota bacterium]